MLQAIASNINTVYCKLFQVEKFCAYKTKLHFTGKYLGLDIILQFCRAIAYFTGCVFHWKSFTVTDQSVKSMKLFHLE